MNNSLRAALVLVLVAAGICVSAFVLNGYLRAFLLMLLIVAAAYVGRLGATESGPR